MLENLRHLLPFVEKYNYHILKADSCPCQVVLECFSSISLCTLSSLINGFHLRSKHYSILYCINLCILFRIHSISTWLTFCWQLQHLTPLHRSQPPVQPFRKNAFVYFQFIFWELGIAFHFACPTERSISKHCHDEGRGKLQSKWNSAPFVKSLCCLNKYNKL